MSRSRKQTEKVVEYDANPTNPLGPACVLLKCRDLYTLSITSISLFYEVLGNVENLKRLEPNYTKLSKRILDVPSCGWLLLMVYASPYTSTLKILEEDSQLVTVFSTARKLPKGLGVRGARGKAHLCPDDHNSIIIASKQAIRLMLTLSGQTNKTALESRSPLWLLELKLLTDDDPLQNALAVNSLLYELENNPKRLIISHELFNMVSALGIRVKKFETAYTDMQTCGQELKNANRALVRARRKFNAELLEVTDHDNEANLDVPLDYYLRDNDMLRKANETRTKALAAKNRAEGNFVSGRGCLDTSFACIRSMCLLVARALSMYVGLYLDSTSLIPLGTDTCAPSTCHTSAALHPIIFGGNSSAPDRNASQREAVVTSVLKDIPWDKLASIAYIERQVAGTVATRVLAAVACKLSDSLQCRLASWAYRAMFDITHDLRWYPVTEKLPDPDAPPSPRDRELLRSLSVEEPPPPRFLFFLRQPTLDTRISTTLTFWCLRGNSAVSSACSRWRVQNEVSPEVTECMWTKIVTRAKEKSEIIPNEQEYYKQVDPYRAFREMDIKNTATKLEELDEETSCSDSDSDQDNSGSDSDDEGHGGLDDEIMMSKEPPHNAVFTKLVKDTYAIAVLHISATEFQDDDLNDFELFRDSRNISTDPFACARFVHQELYSHMDKLLRYTLEGPSDNEAHRYSHPLQIVSALVEQDNTYTMANTLCELDLDCWRYIMSCCIGVKPGVVDIISRGCCVSVLTCSLSGTHPWVVNPSCAPTHCHTVASTKRRRKEYDEVFNPQLKHYLRVRNMLSNVVEIYSDMLYKSTRSDFIPTGENGRCFISRVLRLFIAIADLDSDFIKQQLSQAMARLLMDGDRFWSSHAALPREHLWYAPFLIVWQGGATLLVFHYKRTKEWKKEKGVNDESFGNSVYRCNLDICRKFATLLAVLCSADPEICLFVGEYASIFTEGMMFAMNARDRMLNQQLYRIASSVVNSAKVMTTVGEKVTSSIDYNAPANYFRILLFQEGNGLDIACEMLMDVYSDVWGMDTADAIKNKGNQLGSQTNLKVKPKSSISSLPTLREEKPTSPQLQHGSMGIAAGESVFTLPTQDDGDNPEGGQESEKGADAVSGDNGSDTQKVEADDSSENDDGSMLSVITEWEDTLRSERSREAKDFALFTLESIFELVESRLELQDRVCDKSPEVFKSFYGLLTPKERSQYDQSEELGPNGEVVQKGSGLSVADDGTLSLGNYNPHMGVLGAAARALSVLVKRHTRIRKLVKETGCVEGLMDALDMSYMIDDQVLGLYVVGAVEQLIIRNIDAWKFVKKAAGVKGLLQLCHMGNSAVRILSSTEIISQIYPKHDKKIYAMTEEVLRHKGLATVIRMLHSTTESVQTNSLLLLRTLCVNKLACRRAVLSPEFVAEIGSLLFSPEVSVVRVACEILLVLGAEDQYTLRKLVESMQSAVATLDGYDTGILDRYGVVEECDGDDEISGLSIPARLIDIANGILSTEAISETVYASGPLSPATGVDHQVETLSALMEASIRQNKTYQSEILLTTKDTDPRLMQEVVALANCAASVLAAMTDGEEADWPDGGAPLRHTMRSTGMLPGLYGGPPPKDTSVLNYTL